MSPGFRIVHLIPTLGGGGAERQLSMLAAEQSRRGYDVHLGIRRGGVHQAALNGNGVAMHFMGDHRGISPLLLARITSLIRRVKPDVVQTWLPQMDIVGGVATLWTSVPWIASERVNRSAYEHTPLLAFVRKAVVSRASALVANSSSGVAYWREALFGRGGVFEVSNAVDIVGVRDASSVPSSSAVLGNDKKTILVVGRLDHQKAVDVVIVAISKMTNHRDLRVAIVGDGPLCSELEAMVQSLGLGDRVLMFPYQSDWWRLLKGAVALVSMSRYEGHPNVVLETMAAGCPLVVSDIPEHREFLSEDCAILVPTDRPAALARALSLLLSDPLAARCRAERAVSRVSRLTVDRAADAYDEIYQTVIAGRPL